MDNEITVSGLTGDERTLLAIKAHNEGHSYEDPRYYHDMTWEERMSARDRWWAIARAFDPSIDTRSGHVG